MPKRKKIETKTSTTSTLLSALMVPKSTIDTIKIGSRHSRSARRKAAEKLAGSSTTKIKPDSQILTNPTKLGTKSRPPKRKATEPLDDAPSAKKNKTDSQVKSEEKKSKKKRRKRKKDDLSYNKRAGNKSKKKSGETNVAVMRMNNNKDIKTYVMFDVEKLREANKDTPLGKKIDFDKLEIEMKKIFANIETHGELGEVIEYSQAGSPIKIFTPKKSNTLVRTSCLGFMSTYSNYAEDIPLSKHEQQTFIDNQASFWDSEECKKIDKISQNFKKQIAFITEDSLKKVKKEKEKNEGKRLQSQERVTGVSANKYIRATKLFDNEMKWEWLHLVAHMMQGEASQNVKNLVGGNYHANTNMIPVESLIPYLAKQYPSGFKLEIWADLIPGTHIAKTIKYLIKTDDFTLPFEFDAQAVNKPHASLQPYVDGFVKSVVALTDFAKNPPAPIAVNPTVKRSLYFFNKAAKDVANQTQTQAQPTNIQNTKSS